MIAFVGMYGAVTCLGWIAARRDWWGLIPAAVMAMAALAGVVGPLQGPGGLAPLWYRGSPFLLVAGAVAGALRARSLYVSERAEEA